MKTSYLLLIIFCISCNALTINNLQDEYGYPRIVPSVKEITWHEHDIFKMPKVLTVSAPDSASYEIDTLKRHLEECFGKWEVCQVKPDESAACIMELTSDGTPDNTEGYTLVIKPDGMTIRARNTRGLYYGVQTIGDMLRNTCSSWLKCCTIRDWPDLEMRGVYFVMREMHSGNDVKRVLHAIQALGTMKINTLLLEFGGHLPFEHSMFPDQAKHFTLEELEQIRQCATDNHIEIIPFIQIISHDYWLRVHPDYLTKITARNVDKIPGSNTWQTTNCLQSDLARQTTDFTLAETIKLLKPKMIHLGLDEFEVCHWEQCDHCGKHTLDMIPPLLKHYLELVESLGVTPIVFHDELMTESSRVASAILPVLSRNCIINNWDYQNKPSQKIIDTLQEQGFHNFIGMSYCERLENAFNLPRLMKANGMRGVILSYWDYLGGWLTYKPSCSLEALTATALTAEACWNATGTSDFRDLAWDPSREMRIRLWGASPLRISGTNNIPIPLGSSFNALIGRDANFPKLNTKLAQKLQREASSTPEHFKLETTNDGKLFAIVLSGGNDTYQKDSVTIPINLKTTGLTFLMNTALPTFPGKFDFYHHRYMPEVARLKVHYANGETKELPLLYRSDINCWNSENSGYDTRFVLRGNDCNGSEYAFLAVDWNNPLSTETIDNIEFSAKGDDGVAPALYAISAYQPKTEILSIATIDNSQIKEYYAVTPLPKIIRTRHIGVDFEHGIGDANIQFDGEFDGMPSWEIVNDDTAPKPGKHVLKLTIPPQRKGCIVRSRAIIDLPMPKTEALGSFFVDYRTPQANLMVHSGLYVGNNSNFTGFNVIHGFHAETDVNWHVLEVPFTRMTDEPQPEVTLQTAGIIRFSLWFTNKEQAVTLYVDNIGVSPDDVDWPRHLNSYRIKTLSP